MTAAALRREDTGNLRLIPISRHIITITQFKISVVFSVHISSIANSFKYSSSVVCQKEFENSFRRIRFCLSTVIFKQLRQLCTMRPGSLLRLGQGSWSLPSLQSRATPRRDQLNSFNLRSQCASEDREGRIWTERPFSCLWENTRSFKRPTCDLVPSF